jgi:chromosome condensin MukBEF MukE localization factor
LRHFIDGCGVFRTTTYDKTRGCFERLRRLGLTILLKVNSIKVVRSLIVPVNTDRFGE